jgi:hypothetical protein
VFMYFFYFVPMKSEVIVTSKAMYTECFMNLMFCGPCIVIYLCNKNVQDALFTFNLFV